MGKIPGALHGTEYDQKSIEEWAKNYWSEARIYEKVKAKASKSGRKLYFLDGPPYTSSKEIHIGTGWNKVIKDVFLRYYRMMGYNVWDKPGFDTHGLPIEVQMEKRMGIKTKKEIVEKIGVSRFIEECRRFARENLEGQIEQFKELGVWMDWDNPYITFKNEYINSGWWLIKKAWEKGLLDRDLLVVHWCPRCETTLADYEVSEYKVLRDPSIYVKFKVKGRENEYLLIWTTTPWTLPANAFVMAHPDIRYAKVRVGGDVLILAESRVDHVMREAGVEDYEVVEVVEGRELEGLEYIHPLEDLVDAQKVLSKYHKVVLAPEGVSEHEGTGLVHSAPGHGDVDYEVGKRIGAPVISLVGEDGRMTRDAGKYAGMHFRDEANAEIIKDLRERGALFHAGWVEHRYPVCWRCKTPLVMRATSQWVIRVSKLREVLLREADKVEWKPAWAKMRYLNIIKNVRDWIISRQRFWGIPLPIWVCENCGYIHVVGSVDELEKLSGRRPRDLHRPWVDEVTFKCPRCGGTMRRVPDVADVWFDSGIAFYASLGYPENKELWEKLKPVDFIVEGHDQIRGWFFSLMRSGVVGFGETPYRRVLTHGFVLDEQGREMHKSLGNYVPLRELLNKVPRDIIRMWLMQNTTWEDLRFSWKGLSLMEKDFRIAWNVFAFADLYMSLDGFDPTQYSLESVELEVEDRWLLSKLNSLVRDYHKFMEAMEAFEAARRLVKFIVDDVSHWYIRLIRRRVWVEENTPSKIAAYTTLYTALKTWLLLAAPFIPHLTEYIYQRMFREAEGGPESIHLLELPKADERFIDEKLERHMEVVKSIAEAALAARMKAGIKLRRPVRRLIIAPSTSEAAEAVKELGKILTGVANAKEIEIIGPEFFEKAKVYKLEPKYSEIGPQFKRLTKKVVEIITSNQDEVARSIIEKGYFETVIDGAPIRIEARHVKVKAEYPEWLSVQDSDYGLVGVDLRLSRSEVLEGLAREIVRRIQFMRKKAGYNVSDYIKSYISTSDEEILEAIKEFRDYIMEETRSVEIVLGEGGEAVEEWEIDGSKVKIGVERVSS
ncbi:isoleucine--tRNA ligase [Stetteria hydrogenophila]